MKAPLRFGSWRVRVTDGDSTMEAEAWLGIVERAVETTTPCHRSKHATTYRAVVDGAAVYVKRYHRYRRRTALKDALRPSKARAVLEVSAALAAAGFVVPRVLAAADARRGLALREAWVATAALDGTPVAERVAALAAARAAAPDAEGRAALAAKRRVLAAVGTAVGRLHAHGFVAGDLVAPNVWITAADAVAFLDHDRTRAGRAPAPWMRARRNLVQLNRLVLPGVVATDRLRVYRAYVRARGFGRTAARRRLAWVIAKTIDRRRRFDGVGDAAAIGFRRLMRADAR